MKKTILLIAGGIIILLVGIAAGVLGASWMISNNKEKICASKIKTEISQNQLEDLVSLKPGKIIYGKVVSKDNSVINILSSFINPLNPQEKKDIAVKVNIGQKDEFIRLKKVAPGSDNGMIKSSINDVKVGDYLTVKVLNDRKIIYLPAI
ncbi:MAG: hypothetical protein QMD86_02045 [Patescibacteria group bacterium]|nr:hypothetical protein [Patescibacteria group bacterium]